MEMELAQMARLEDHKSTVRGYTTGETGIQQRRRVAGKQGDMPARTCCRSGSDGESAAAGPDRPTTQKFTAARRGAQLETIETKPVFDGDQIRALEIEQDNRAKELIADFMIAANGVTVRYLSSGGFPSIRRVVRTPKRWDRIVEIAQEHSTTFRQIRIQKRWKRFSSRQKAADPLHFPDLSLTVIKLLGSGEYVANRRMGTRRGTLGWQSKIILTRRHRIAAP